MNSNSTILELKSEKKRLYLLDLFKLFSIISIVFFHFNEFLFDTDYHPLRPFTIIYRFVGVFCEYTSFSGQSIVSVFAFLVGFRFTKTFGRKQIWYFLGLFAFGYLIVNWGYYGEAAFAKFYWDIYPFLGISFLSLLLILANSRAIRLSMIVGLFLLIYPYQQFSLNSTDYSPWREIVFGYCNADLKSSWPLVPWIGLVWLFGGFGFYAQRNDIYDRYLVKMNNLEKGIWLLVVAGTFMNYRYFANAPYGDSLYCFVLQAPHLTVLAYMTLIALVLRLSFLDNVNKYCVENKILSFLLRSSWCRNFGLAYLVHLVMLIILGTIRSFVVSSPVIFDLAIILVFVGVEVIVPTLNKIFERVLLKSK